MTISLRARAKINLTLEILGKRDDGYHEVKTVLQTIDLADVVNIAPSATLQVECSDPELNGENNLVWRAASALAKSTGCIPRASIFIQKAIPQAMGLGGGSSDAAVALLALNRLWGTDLSLEQLTGIAGELGADVPFFMSGGTALATGKGDIITLLSSAGEGSLVSLICPDTSLPDKTSRLYSCVTPQHYSDGAATARAVAAIQDGRFGGACLHNCFQSIAMEVFPGLKQLHDTVARLCARPLCLSGAGPALFFFPQDEREHQAVLGALHQTGTQMYLVRITGPQAHTDEYTGARQISTKSE